MCLLRSLWPLHPCAAIIGPTTMFWHGSFAPGSRFLAVVADIEATGVSGVSAGVGPPRDAAMRDALAGAMGHQVGRVGDVVVRNVQLVTLCFFRIIPSSNIGYS